MVVSAGAVSFIILEANGSSDCGRGGGDTGTHTHTHIDRHRAVRGAGGHARPQGKSCCVVMFFLPRHLYQLVFLTLNKPRGRAPDSFLF